MVAVPLMFASATLFWAVLHPAASTYDIDITTAGAGGDLVGLIIGVIIGVCLKKSNCGRTSPAVRPAVEPAVVAAAVPVGVPTLDWRQDGAGHGSSPPLVEIACTMRRELALKSSDTIVATIDAACGMLDVAVEGSLLDRAGGCWRALNARPSHSVV